MVGVLADQFLRVATFGLAATAMLVAAALTLAIANRSRRVEPLALGALGVTFAAFITVRSSPWLVWPDLFVSIALLGAAASIAVRGSLLDVGVSEIAARACHALVHLLAGIGFVASPLIDARHRMAKAGPLARGLLIATPIAVLITALLASADPVFASFLTLNVDIGQFLLDVVFVSIGVVGMAGLIRLAAAEPLDRINGPTWRLGTTEALVVLAVLDAIFAAFALAQALAATGAAAQTLREAGTTYSDYARNGFFQLLWVAGITLAVLVALSRISRLSSRAFVALELVAIALTMLIVFVAYRRLSLYEEAYGFTMLRLYSHIFAVWVAAVFLLLAADLLGVWRGRRWFAGAAAATALAVLLALNVLSPEALVVGHNVERAHATQKLDTDYLASLSSDATPAMVNAMSVPGISSQLRGAACSGPKEYAPSLAAFNVADQAAAAARRADC
ncbi:MAG TPA: DUF4173 domain-containing protein [Candidatus Dormibacteraeota bacterium]|nr:DUF4173 domain-containing protein [Candidatus Dormibacteraeota bacterium]